MHGLLVSPVLFCAVNSRAHPQSALQLSCILLAPSNLRGLFEGRELFEEIRYTYMYNVYILLPWLREVLLSLYYIPHQNSKHITYIHHGQLVYTCTLHVWKFICDISLEPPALEKYLLTSRCIPAHIHHLGMVYILHIYTFVCIYVYNGKSA